MHSIQLTSQEIIAFMQLLMLPLLGLIWSSVKKIHRGNKLNGFKIEALVHALQHESKNGLMTEYDKKLHELKSDANWIEDKK